MRNSSAPIDELFVERILILLSHCRHSRDVRSRVVKALQLVDAVAVQVLTMLFAVAGRECLQSDKKLSKFLVRCIKIDTIFSILLHSNSLGHHRAIFFWNGRLKISNSLAASFSSSVASRNENID
jgi:hypothetical protein